MELTHIGHHLKELRMKWGRTLRELSTELKVSHQLLSKVEQGKIVPNEYLLKNYALCFNIPVDILRIIKVTDELLKTSQHIHNRRDIGRIVKERLLNPDKLIHIPNSEPLVYEKVKIPMEKQRRYKVKGFGYIIQSNGKLRRVDRKDLLRKSKHYMSEIDNLELDSSHTDMEIIIAWNDFFDTYGSRFQEFIEEWLEYNLPVTPNEATLVHKTISIPSKLPKYNINKISELG